MTIRRNFLVEVRQKLVISDLSISDALSLLISTPILQHKSIEREGESVKNREARFILDGSDNCGGALWLLSFLTQKD